MPRVKSPLNVKRDEIRAWFSSCDPKQTQVKDALKRAAKLIWQYQTSQEQDSATTTDHNGVGYNKYDADFAHRITHWNGTLPDKLALGARTMLRKYAKQLAKIKIGRDAMRKPTQACRSLIRAKTALKSLQTERGIVYPELTSALRRISGAACNDLANLIGQLRAFPERNANTNRTV